MDGQAPDQSLLTGAQPAEPGPFIPNWADDLASFDPDFLDDLEPLAPVWPDNLESFQPIPPQPTSTTAWTGFDMSTIDPAPLNYSLPANTWDPTQGNPPTFQLGHGTLPVNNSGLGGFPNPNDNAFRTSISPSSSTDTSPVRAREEELRRQVREFSSTDKTKLHKLRLRQESQDPYETILTAQANVAPTRQFPGLFLNAGAANQARSSLQTLMRPPNKECTTPADDPTFPVSDADMVAVVASVFNAICDWSYLLEWKSVLCRNARVRITDELVARRSGPGVGHTDAENIRPTSPELADMLPPLEVQQKKVLGQVPSDLAIECISWAIVLSKQLVKSLLTAGDGWILRIVNCPRKEFHFKGKNRQRNAKRMR
ncbi:hypothetical protein CDD80_3777 [Ophiocordyceps camponoti-rufipedis]|uniref:Uncharacterized protein n=1 Tax=Ophiocordyceps camponoti-rufipedis TaxID=2004952 RepID=A0A2C5ZK64_9HYPO|nr:hypothetical protein CDD80_3777 [Ophiocordyceps camponoti-rufipedis]